jgi:hypothetical protein
MIAILFFRYIDAMWKKMTDMYYVEKLLYLKGDDGFQMNQVLVSLWNVMGIMPTIYCMLLIPTGRRYGSARNFVKMCRSFHENF